MSDQDKQEAEELARRAGAQGRHAIKNTGRAAGAAGRAVADEATEVVADTARATRRVAPRFSARGLAAISGDTGTGFLALAVSIYSGAIAYTRFRAAIQGRGRAIGE